MRLESGSVKWLPDARTERTTTPERTTSSFVSPRLTSLLGSNLTGVQLQSSTTCWAGVKAAFENTVQLETGSWRRYHEETNSKADSKADLCTERSPQEDDSNGRYVGAVLSTMQKGVAIHRS